MSALSKKVKDRNATVAVIGLGYVGLPLLLILSDLGFKAVGIDKNREKVTTLKKGKIDFLKNSPKVAKLLGKSLKKKNFIITDNFSEIKRYDFIFITVDTPIKSNKLPDQTNIKKASVEIGRNLKKGTIVVIESTISPGTTKNLVVPTIEKFSKLKNTVDFNVVVCSERIRPSYDAFEDMKQLPRVLGLSNPDIIPAVRGLYKLITTGDIDVVDIITAEVVKTAENAFRDVKIAFANEVALICEEVNANVLAVRELVNKRYQREDMLMPGAGVGGHCLPKDPWLLLSAAQKNNLSVIPSARKLNSYMPQHIAKHVLGSLHSQGIKPKNAKVAILGISYIENCEDTRNSPSKELIRILENKKIDLRIHDPYVTPYSHNSVEGIVKDTDCLVLMVAHNQYKKINLARVYKLMRNKIIVDGRNFFDRKTAERLGFLYKGIGNV